MNIKKEVENITEQIINKYKPEKVIIFGSFARNEFNKDSDIDFLIIKKDIADYGIDRIREISRLIERKTAVDFLIYKPDEIDKRLKLEDPFIKVIFEEGKVVYDKLSNNKRMD